MGALERLGFEVRIEKVLRQVELEGILVMDARDLAVHVEDFALVEAERFHDVLIGVRMERLFESLAQQVLARFGVREVLVHREHEVVRDERVRRREEAEVALDDATFVFAQLIGLPELDVASHGDFLRHPMVRASVEVVLPRPLVLDRDELVEVGAAVDELFLIDLDARRLAQFEHALLGGLENAKGRHVLSFSFGPRLTGRPRNRGYRSSKPSRRSYRWRASPPRSRRPCRPREPWRREPFAWR